MTKPVPGALAPRTGSPVGRRVLDEWETLAPSFVKIYPTDYKRVLAERAGEAVAA